MRIVQAALMLLMSLSFGLQADNHAGSEAATYPAGERAAVVTAIAEVASVNYETREVGLKGPDGDVVIVKAGEDITRLEEIEVGDGIRATYVTALAAELREPTEAELMMPWVVVTDEARTVEGETPAGGMARTIRAVCTIEGMNRLTRTVMIQDPRGLAHVIGDVQPETFPLLSLGQQVIITFTEAVALSLEELPVPAE